MATRMPRMTKLFLVSCTSRLVNIIEMALVSLVTRVTSLPTGIWFSWAWDSCSMWVKVSRRIWDRIFWPVFCRIMA